MDRRHFVARVATLSAAGTVNQSLRPAAERRKPPRLRAGDTIGLVTPAHYATETQLQLSVANLAKLGFRTRFTPNMLVRKGYLAGTDEQRADDLNRMFADETVAGILCVTGGYGTTRLLPHLDYDLIRSNPKPLIGFSDITGLLYGLYGQAGLIGFHGPVGDSDFNDYTTYYFRQVLMEPTGMLTYEPPTPLTHDDLVPLYLAGQEVNISQPVRLTLSSGAAEGELVGGNLSLVTALCGTAYDLDFSGKIVFLEDVGESPYRIDRMLTQLRLAPDKLSVAAGVVLGLFTNCEADDETTSLSLSQVLYDRLADLKIPVLYGLTFGHVRRNAMLPFGGRARLDADAKTLTLVERVVT